jgi:peptidoglycan DL-endopeptidase CwlO
VLHEVQQDDTVFAIAAKYGASAIDVVEANGLQDPYVILNGQILIVPGGTPWGTPIQVAATPKPTVKPAANAPRPTATRPVPVTTQRPQPTATPKPPAKPVQAPPPAKAPPPAAPAAAPKPAGPANSVAANIALQYRGWNYVWGGTSPSQGGFDCSGLTWFAYRQAGKAIPRDLWGQLNSGSRVPRANLQYGDLVFFQNTYAAGLSHVGIYIGGNSFVHASSERTGVIVSSLGDSYWAAHYLGASRP